MLEQVDWIFRFSIEVIGEVVKLPIWDSRIWEFIKSLFML